MAVRTDPMLLLVPLATAASALVFNLVGSLSSLLLPAYR